MVDANAPFEQRQDRLHLIKYSAVKCGCVPLS